MGESMDYTFGTDPHLGVSRSEHTSTKSQIALREHVFQNCLDVFRDARGRKYLLGDLFDKHSNPESIVAQGLEIARLLDKVLGGNHDQKNIAGSVSSLSLIKKALDDEGDENFRIVINPDVTKPYCYTEVDIAEKVSITFVPHMFTQELFVESLKEARNDVGTAAGTGDIYKILCLHCNLGENFGKAEAEGSTLALTNELQLMVLEAFDLVLIGHEHETKTLHGGRIVSLGNLYPVSFGELSDRYVWTFNSDTRKLTKHKVFTAKDAVVYFDAKEFVEMADVELAHHQWVEINGEVQPQEYPKVARAIMKMWNDNPDLLMVRNNVTVIHPEKHKANTKGYVPRSLAETVRDSVKDAGFGEEFAELSKEVDE